MSHNNTVVSLGSGAMFDGIAARYDFLNTLLSFGFDKLWRRVLVRALELAHTRDTHVLDVATGTADVALTVARMHRRAYITGVDPSANMRAIGCRKIEQRNVSKRIQLLEGSAEALPFLGDAFDAACISFGIRNVPDRLQALREMRRVVRSGGRVAVLELGEPRDMGLLGHLARVYVHKIVPKIGAWISGGGFSGSGSGGQAYAYLQQSIALFPPPQEFVALMHEAGLRDVSYRTLMFGVAHVYVGRV